jgi:hypothetical protein
MRSRNVCRIALLRLVPRILQEPWDARWRADGVPSGARDAREKSLYMSRLTLMTRSGIAKEMCLLRGTFLDFFRCLDYIHDRLTYQA